MIIQFKNLKLTETDGKLTLFGFPFVEINVAGRNKPYSFGAVGSKLICSSEVERLTYDSFIKKDQRLKLVQKNELIKVTTTFENYKDTNAISVVTEVENISKQVVTLENVSTLVFPLEIPLEKTAEAYLYKFTQGHHGECQPVKTSVYDLGLTSIVSTGQKRVSGMNVGSWSTKEELPQGIIEYNGKWLMFQIESNNSWYYEIGDRKRSLYLYMGGATESFGSWTKTLEPFERYITKTAVLSFGQDLNGVIGEMTKYRRKIAGKRLADEKLPCIFNEYMHLSWDCPSEDRVKIYAPKAREAGSEYYVIDCGWHDEQVGYLYPFVGKWKESSVRFPSGVKTICNYIKSLGMKAGLWIEPEVVGVKCSEMIEYYGEECFLHRHGKKIQVCDRYFLDFRKEKVVKYLTETICRMVEDYGAEYIKLDYNQDLGVGCDGEDGFGEGLERCANAYLAWIDSVRKKFPNVIFETCASGGMRMDYQTLRRFSITSTSDQTDYLKYPYIACNILSAVLPEQAAVWSYPVGMVGKFEQDFTATSEWVEKFISKEQIIMNMINAFLGRMHLASHLELLSDDKFDLVKEGVEYYNKLSKIKRSALPVFPLGFKRIKDMIVAGGLETEKKLYLAVWNLGENASVRIPIEESASAECVYPKGENVEILLDKKEIIVQLKACTARFFEILKK